MIRTALFALSVSAAVLCSCARNPEPITDQAQPYRIVGTWEDGVTLRLQHHVGVVAKISSVSQAEQTAIRAALDIRHADPRFDVVAAHVVPDANLLVGGHDLAVATFAKDGRGYSGNENWQWELTAVPKLPSQDDINTVLAWERERSSYMRPDGKVDEAALRLHISNQLGRQISYVPWWFMESRPVVIAKAK